MHRRVRVPLLLRRPAQRLLSTPADGVRAVVLRIAGQHASGEPDDLNADLPTKFEVRWRKETERLRLLSPLCLLPLRRSCSQLVNASLVWRCRT